MTKDKFLSIYPKNVTAATRCYDALQDALMELGICTQTTLVGALATVRVECGIKFAPIPEYASGAAYEGRKDLGNTQKGDGVRFKGRGYIQLTGRSNYEVYGKLLGVDLIKNPELALDVKTGARILALYFKNRKVNVACDKKDWVRVRRLINGGNGVDKKKGGTTNGLDEFLQMVTQYTK
jgi:predicted chitinase